MKYLNFSLPDELFIQDLAKLIDERGTWLFPDETSYEVPYRLAGRLRRIAKRFPKRLRGGGSFKIKPLAPMEEPLAPMEKEIRAVCDELADFLVEKNKAYGNSAAEPIHIFAKGIDARQQIDVRIDDKLNRLAKGGEYPGDDTIKDLAGYLILRMALAPGLVVTDR